MANMNEIEAFVNAIRWEYPNSMKLTEEEAQYNIDNWKADGIEIPKGLTAKVLMDRWNDNDLEYWLVFTIRKYDNYRHAVIGVTNDRKKAETIAENYKKLHENERSYVGVGVMKDNEYIKFYGEY